MRLQTLRTAAIGLAALAVPASAGAHHSFNMFALDKIVTISGTVKDYQFKMPHVWLYMMMPAAAGEAAQEWGFEAHAPNMVARKGWSINTLKPGDKLTVVMHPMKDGSHAGQCRAGHPGRRQGALERRIRHPALATAMRWLTLALVLVCGAAHAADIDVWRKARQAKFAARPAAAGAVWDAPEAPEMVVVPAGRFMMGLRPTDTDLRGAGPPPGSRHEVSIPRPFAVGKYPITVGEFATFAARTGHKAADSCWTFEGIEGTIRKGRSWRNPGFAQTPNDPVLCVSWTDVQAYAAWVSGLTGHRYRLLSEAEYEYVNRAGTDTAWWWGEEVGANHANCDGCGSLWDNRTTSPVGSFAPNPFGLYDTAGDTWVWVADCHEGTDCAEHILRGGAWHGGPNGLRSTSRFWHTTETHSATLGFRLAREL